ncbi:MAG: GIY-YIG nuclease family protein [Lachnospiraceae bacterium]|nr:GIY-YIG nuclease family protein [Lachnospiraceae bacterium]
MNYTYMVECSDGTLYTGWTNNLEKRIKAHNDGKGAKYTKTSNNI